MASRIASTLEHAGPGPWVAAAHSFGCLALVRYLMLNPGSPLVGALLVAPVVICFLHMQPRFHSFLVGGGIPSIGFPFVSATKDPA